MANRTLDMRYVHHELDLALAEAASAMADSILRDIDANNDFDTDLDPREMTELGRRQIRQEEEEMADRGNFYDDYSDYEHY